MAAVDLDFEQLQAAGLPDNAIYVAEDLNGNIGYIISVSTICGETIDSPENQSVIKVLMKLYQACLIAQQNVNANVPEEQQLTAFPAVTTAGTVADGFIEQTATIKSRVDISSAIKIVGTVG